MRQQRLREPDAVRERERSWRDRNPEVARAKQRRAYAKNGRARAAQERAKHPERIAARARRYYLNNREAVIAKSAEKTHLRRARLVSAPGHFTSREFKALCQELGNACVYCGVADQKLTADHVVPLSRGGTNDIDNIVPCCRSCNASKGDRTPDEWLAA